MILQIYWIKSDQNRHDNNTLINPAKPLPGINLPSRSCTSHQPALSSCSCAWYKSRPHPHFAVSSSLLFIHPTQLPLTLIKLHQSLSSHPNYHLRFLRNHSIHQKCLQKLPRRSPPLVARPQLARLLLLRRRKLARRPRPLPLVRRRSEARRERRPTLHTSTKVSSLTINASHSYFSIHTDASSQSSSKSTLTLVSPTAPCPS